MGECRILSRRDEAFSDRVEAGRALAAALMEYAGLGAVVLGIPRGGVIVAREVARRLDADLDIVLARKLGAPGNPELAIGALAEDGRPFVDDHLAGMVGADRAYIEGERARQLAELRRRAAAYRAVRPKVPLVGRTVIVTDDGVATGSTMQAALWAVRQEDPQRLVLALPLGPEHTVRQLAQHADRTVCLRAPDLFHAVGQFYLAFDQTEDRELVALLAEETERAKGKTREPTRD